MKLETESARSVAQRLALATLNSKLIALLKSERLEAAAFILAIVDKAEDLARAELGLRAKSPGNPNEPGIQ
jgi:hypothetical protein